MLKVTVAVVDKKICMYYNVKDALDCQWLMMDEKGLNKYCIVKEVNWDYGDSKDFKVIWECKS